MNLSSNARHDELCRIFGEARVRDSHDVGNRHFRDALMDLLARNTAEIERACAANGVSRAELQQILASEHLTMLGETASAN